MRPTLSEQAGFALRLGVAHLLSRRRSWLFNYVDIARAQNVIRFFVRRPYGVLLCGVEALDPELGSDRKAVLRNAVARIAISGYTARHVSEQHPKIGPVIACPLALLPAPPLLQRSTMRSSVRSGSQGS
jgi:hypothetical protein